MNTNPLLSPSPAAPVPVRSPRTSILLAELARQRRLECRQRQLKRRQRRRRLGPGGGGVAGRLAPLDSIRRQAVCSRPLAPAACLVYGLGPAGLVSKGSRRPDWLGLNKLTRSNKLTLNDYAKLLH